LKTYKEFKVKFSAFVLIAILTLCVWGAQAQSISASAANQAAIKQTALDYIEGWYEGNAERMDRAIHPELVKRIVRANEKGQSGLRQTSAISLLQDTREGYGKNTPKEKQQKDVMILDVFENTACVKIVASGWIDYLHIAKFNGRWMIINVLWELKIKK
jgi:hypothetical protein